jgi:benzoate membrane transport protein
MHEGTTTAVAQENVPASRGLSLEALGAGLLAALVGFASSFAVIIEGLTAVGATPAEAASGLMALSVGMGLCGVYLSLKTRMPISIAWSTPGAALLATSGRPEGGFAVAVGAFLVVGVLIIIAGLWRPLGRAVAAIPAALANAMLAGVLLSLCLAPVRAVAEMPVVALPMVAAWALVARFKRLYAMPAAVLVTVALVMATAHGSPRSVGSLLPAPVLTIPGISLAALIGLAVPLFIVTMASQNIPGIAVLNVNGSARHSADTRSTLPRSRQRSALDRRPIPIRPAAIGPQQRPASLTLASALQRKPRPPSSAHRPRFSSRQSPVSRSSGRSGLR